VSSGGITTIVSPREFFSMAVEAKEGRTKAELSFGSLSSSLRQDSLISIKRNKSKAMTDGQKIKTYE
jgi:hypothetical protein